MAILVISANAITAELVRPGQSRPGETASLSTPKTSGRKRKEGGIFQISMAANLRQSVLLLLLLLVFAFAFFFASATDHIVGGDHGWNPNIDYSAWAHNTTFYAGDLISFRYQKGVYNVFEVNETGYNNCTMDGLAGNWSSGKDFIPLPRPKTYYFICGNGFCFSGMKVAVRVLPLPSNASASDSASASLHAGQKSDAAAAAVLRGWAAAAGAFAAVWIAVGSGGI